MATGNIDPTGKGFDRLADLPPVVVVPLSPERKAQLAEMENRFSYHPPAPGQQEKYRRLRDWALGFALQITEDTPASREQSLALTHLDSVVMFANAAIARRS